MKISFRHLILRPLLLTSAMGIGLAGSLAAAEKKIVTPPRAEPVLHNDPQVYMIVEDPRLSPKPGTQVIEVIPENPPVEKRSSRSSSTRKSRSSAPERGETIYVEDPAQQVIIVEPPPAPSVSIGEEAGIVKQESTTTRKAPSKRTTTTQRSSSSPKVSSKSSSDDTQREVRQRSSETAQRSSSSSRTSVKTESDDTTREVRQLQEQVTKLEGELDRAKTQSATTTSTTATVRTVENPDALPTAPLPSVTEERLPLVSSPTAVQTSQTTVTEKKILNEKVPEDRPLPPAKIDPPSPKPSADPLDTTPPPPIVDAQKDSPPPPAPTKPEHENAPTAKKTDKPGIVTSPYPPHRLIDVRGMAPGTLAKDPSTEEVFRVP